MIWNATLFDVVHCLRAAHTGAVFDIALVSMRLNEQSTLELWSASKDQRVRVWDAESFHCVRELRGHDMCVSAVAQVGHTLVWSVGEVSVYYWFVCFFFFEKKMNI